MLSRVAYVSRIVGAPIAVLAEFEPRHDATDYCGPMACSLALNPIGAKALPLLSSDDLDVIREEAEEMAREMDRPRFTRSRYF